MSLPDNWTFTPLKKLNSTGCVKLPPGTYWFGDLCYVLEKIYHTVFGATGYSDGLYTNGTHSFLVAGTAYGDGGYPGSDGHEYLVDAGILGIVSTELMDKGGLENAGSFITSAGEVTCNFSGRTEQPNGYFEIRWRPNADSPFFRMLTVCTDGSEADGSEMESDSSDE